MADEPPTPDPTTTTGRAAKPAAPRTPRAPRKKVAPEVVVESTPALVVAPSPHEARLAAGVIRQAGDELDAVHARRDQLLESIAAAERRLAALRDEARALEDLSAVRAALDQAGERVRDLTREAGDAHREANEAAETFREVTRLLDSARADVGAVQEALAEADAAARDAETRAAAATTEAGRARQLLAGVRDEFGTLGAAARCTLDELLAAVEAARLTPVPTPTPAPAPVPPVVAEAVSPPPPPPSPDAIPGVTAVPSGEQAADARDRLVRYLNDAGAVAREQAGLLQALADGTDDAGLRAALEGHREVSRRQLADVEGRVWALGGEPAAGRNLLGQVVTRIWDALQKPRDGADDAAEVLLKALGAAEFGAAAFLTVYAFARATGDADTAALMAAHFREERDLTDRLRGMIPACAERAAAGRPVTRPHPV